MNKPLLLTAIVLASGAGYWAGHASSPKSPLDSAADGAVVARFGGGQVVRVGDVEARARALPEVVRARLRDPEARKGFIEELVRERLLARKAEESGFQRDPEFAKRYAQELGSFYLEKELEEPARRRPPTEVELRKYFDEHRAELSRPERVRVAIIAVKVPSPAERERKRAAARELLAEARSRSNDYYAFGRLARTRSDDERTRASSGEVGYASREELTAAYGPELAAAAFGLKSGGELVANPVEGADAFYVAKLVGRQEAYEPRFEVVKDTLAAQVGSERRTDERKRFLYDLWKQADVKIDDGAVQRLSLAAGGR